MCRPAAGATAVELGRGIGALDGGVHGTIHLGSGRGWAIRLVRLVRLDEDQPPPATVGVGKGTQRRRVHRVPGVACQPAAPLHRQVLEAVGRRLIELALQVVVLVHHVHTHIGQRGVKGRAPLTAVVEVSLGGFLRIRRCEQRGSGLHAGRSTNLFLAGLSAGCNEGGGWDSTDGLGPEQGKSA